VSSGGGGRKVVVILGRENTLLIKREGGGEKVGNLERKGTLETREKGRRGEGSEY